MFCDPLALQALSEVITTYCGHGTPGTQKKLPWLAVAHISSGLLLPRCFEHSTLPVVFPKKLFFFMVDF